MDISTLDGDTKWLF